MTALLSLAPLLLLAASQKAPPTTQTPLPASIDGLPIGAIPRQDLPATGCAAYLWTTSGTRAFVAMAQADPARLRLSLGGRITDLDRTAQSGAGGFGFGETNAYAANGITVKLTMTIETRESLTGGAVVTDALLQLDRPGQDTVLIPVGGLIGCAS